MRLKRACMVLTVLAFGMALIATPASAQRGRERSADRERPSRMERMSERLELSEEQRTAIERILETAKTRAVEQRKEMARQRHEMKGEMLKDEPSEAALTRAIEKIGAMRTKQQVDRMKDRMAIRKLLTPEQRDKWCLMGSRFSLGGDERGPRFGIHGKRGMRRMPGAGPCDRLPERRHFWGRSGPSGFSFEFDLDDGDFFSDLEQDFGEIPDLKAMEELIRERLSLLDDMQ